MLAYQEEGIFRYYTVATTLCRAAANTQSPKGFGQLHNFFLEEVEDYGANQIAKFAR